jgi:hypothetical protein
MVDDLVRVRQIAANQAFRHAQGDLAGSRHLSPSGDVMVKSGQRRTLFRVKARFSRSQGLCHGPFPGERRLRPACLAVAACLCRRSGGRLTCCFLCWLLLWRWSAPEMAVMAGACTADLFPVPLCHRRTSNWTAEVPAASGAADAAMYKGKIVWAAGSRALMAAGGCACTPETAHD